MKQYRCTFTNDFHRVGQRISEFEYDNLPYSIKDDYKKVLESEIICGKEKNNS